MTDYFTDALARITAVTTAVAPDLDMTAGSVLQQLSTGIASSHADVKASQDASFAQAFLPTATGQSLAQLALDRNVIPGIATATVISVLFTTASGAPGGSITLNQGFTVWTAASQSGAPIRFTLQSPLVIPSPGSASGPCMCTQPGSIGNVPVGAVTQYDSFASLSSVVNQSTISLGIDAEADTALRGRATAAKVVAYSAAQMQSVAKATGAAQAILYDPRDKSGITTLYAAAADGTLSPTLQAAVQAAINAVLIPSEVCNVVPFAMVFAPLAVAIFVPSGYDVGVTEAAVQAQSITFANTLAPGQTMQPLAWQQAMVKAIPALAAPGADFYPTTTPPPTVPATSLFRFLAPPAAPTLVQQVGGSLTLLSTVYVVVTWSTATGDTIGSVEESIVLTGSNNEVVVTVPAAPFSNVTEAKVYASTASGVEELQGTIAVTTTAGGSLTLSTVSTGGATVPTTGTISQPDVAATSF